MIDVQVPQLGESVTEGTISKWLVKEGDFVAKDQPIAEIATDKADSELPAPAGGRVMKLLAKEGDIVPVRTVICQIDESATAAAGGNANEAAPHAASPNIVTKTEEPIPPSVDPSAAPSAPAEAPGARLDGSRAPPGAFLGVKTPPSASEP